ncbi:hypothetical protein CALVIDRAFT_247193 [Calocera viscosa TUFC12733]|uniref:Uncharacterized protein n=1 Tax=Calocera viscosa (strain TUFC12733) TaxID=1330018 RepID=A0A167JJZ7_CALVF|nr:hypothetical protein CALVIDRAFT_247193 [Calocera viscosa TUFC12733]
MPRERKPLTPGQYAQAICQLVFSLAMLGMACYIPVGLPKPLPGWVISMFVAYACAIIVGLWSLATGTFDGLLFVVGVIAWIGVSLCAHSVAILTKSVNWF